MTKRLVLLLLATTTAACIESREAPERLPQATIEYGPRIWLVDDTFTGAPNSGWCTRRVNIVPTTTTATITGVMDVDGKGVVWSPETDAMTPASCFIDVVPNTLRVDRVETTNELFQLCVDSGACSKPDPSKASKGPLCNDPDEFDTCPVVEVTQSQASNFCKWVGRRLPTSIEHIAIRQANAQPTATPSDVTVYPTGDAAPNSCDTAVVKANGCLKPRPVDLAGDSVTGAASEDVVAGKDPDSGASGAAIYDVMGNVAEWSGDLFPVSRGPQGPNLPWFCIAPLSEEAFSEENPPVCPATAKCVWGQYRPYEGAAFGIWPVCIISDNAAFSGIRGAVHGGSYLDDAITRDVVGTYARRVETEPEELPDTQRARSYGFRCVGQRESAGDDGTVPEFDDGMEVVTPPEAMMQ